MTVFCCVSLTLVERRILCETSPFLHKKIPHGWGVVDEVVKKMF